MKKYSIIIALILSLIGCNQSEIKTKSSHYIGTLKLMPININDSIFKGRQVWFKDTLLKSGWNIQYLVKDDSRKYKDLYIQWTKDSKKGLVRFESVLELNGVSIPTFEGENDKNIFMIHACSSTCRALLILRKDSIPSYTDYLDIVDYSLKFGQILYITNKTNDDSLLQVSLVDLNKKQEYIIDFKYKCSGVFKSSYIDTVIFGLKKSIIKGNFDDESGEHKIKEQREIKL
jgi:hypothetical protein